MADGYVQVATDGSGKKVDTAELIRVDGTTVERQRVALGSDDDPTAVAKFTAAGLEVATDLGPVVVQLKRIALLLEILTGQEVRESDVSKRG